MNFSFSQQTESASVSRMASQSILKEAFNSAIKVVKPSNIIKNRLQIDSNANFIIQDVFDRKFSVNLARNNIFLIGFGEFSP